MIIKVPGTGCANCKTLEKHTRQAIAEKYEAIGSALFLKKTTGVKESKTDLTDYAFSYVRNSPDKFISG
jgi:hypothetical protein